MAPNRQFALDKMYLEVIFHQLNVEHFEVKQVGGSFEELFYHSYFECDSFELHIIRINQKALSFSQEIGGTNAN